MSPLYLITALLLFAGGRAPPRCAATVRVSLLQDCPYFRISTDAKTTWRNTTLKEYDMEEYDMEEYDMIVPISEFEGKPTLHLRVV